MLKFTKFGLPAIVATMTLSACGEAPSSPAPLAPSYSSNSEPSYSPHGGIPTSGDEDSEERECTEPENPYDVGSGHYAGFEWAERTGGACTADSEPFNEGCEEYESQEEAFNECESNN